LGQGVPRPPLVLYSLAILHYYYAGNAAETTGNATETTVNATERSIPTFVPAKQSTTPFIDQERGGLSRQSSSYIALVGVAVAIIVALFVLLVVSVIVLTRMRMKYHKADRGPVSPIMIPANRRHTIF
jgi:hypothetical protein